MPRPMTRTEREATAGKNWSGSQRSRGDFQKRRIAADCLWSVRYGERSSDVSNRRRGTRAASDFRREFAMSEIRVSASCFIKQFLDCSLVVVLFHSQVSPQIREAAPDGFNCRSLIVNYAEVVPSCELMLVAFDHKTGELGCIRSDDHPIGTTELAARKTNVWCGSIILHPSE
jgi:hypothetical protein